MPNAFLALSAPVRASRRRQARAENTLTAMRVGHAHGYRMVEFDVKLAADNVSFLLHDATLERTTSGRGRADALLWRELSRLDAGGWHSAKYAGEPLPTLASIARWARAHGVACNIEIKPTPGRERETGAAVALDAAALWRDAEVPPLLSSFSEDALDAARDAGGAPGAAAGRAARDWLGASRGSLRGAGAATISHGDIVTSARLRVPCAATRRRAARIGELAGWASTHHHRRVDVIPVRPISNCFNQHSCLFEMKSDLCYPNVGSL
jgi:hypothetical protein